MTSATFGRYIYRIIQTLSCCMVFAGFCIWYLQHFELQPSILRGGLPFWSIVEAMWNLNLLTSWLTSWSFHQRKDTKNINMKAPQLRSSCVSLCCSCSCFSCFSCCSCCYCCFCCYCCSCCSFVFAALGVCAAGAVLHVVIAALEIQQNNNEASRKQKTAKQTKQSTKKEKKQRSRKTEKQKSRETKKRRSKTHKNRKQRSKKNRKARKQISRNQQRSVEAKKAEKQKSRERKKPEQREESQQKSLN